MDDLRTKILNLRILNKISRRLRGYIQWFKDYYVKYERIFDEPIIANSFVSIYKLDISKVDLDICNYLSNYYRQHYFDLLGSGWVQVSYQTTAIGVEGFQYRNQCSFKIDKENDWLTNIVRAKYLAKSKYLLQQTSKDYQPIDWQLDFKSGFRWDARIWYKKQPYGHLPGVDIKVPWELARLQHLVQLAIFAIKSPVQRIPNILEFKDQILDFMAQNPPRMGVNWVCTMDVGIRAVNILISFDLFKQLDFEHYLDNDFEKNLSKYVHEHGKHIIENLEYFGEYSGNHYYANLAGLIFIGAYLKSTPLTDQWLLFGYSELLSEFDRQFASDGGHFERSTCYHRLMLEMTAYTFAIIERIDDRIKLLLEKKKRNELVGLLRDQKIQVKLRKATTFLQDIIKPSGEISQIGDNDSGRFIKLTPFGKLITSCEARGRYLNLKSITDLPQAYWDENELFAYPITSVVNGLYDSNKMDSDEKFLLERSVIKALRGNSHWLFPELDCSSSKKLDLKRLSNEDNLPYKQSIFFNGKNNGENFINGLTFKIYPESGIVIYKSKRLFLLIAFAELGLSGLGAHNHNDIGTFELSIDGHDKIIDPGTYLYTSLPDRRNEFRSTKIHPVPYIDNKEQRDLSSNLFLLKEKAKWSIQEIQANRFELLVNYDDIVWKRCFEITSDNITIIDFCNRPFIVNQKPVFFSNGYGKLCQVT